MSVVNTYKRAIHRSRVYRTLCIDTSKAYGGIPESGVFIHISPSGDAWVGPSMFAAKHLPSNYLRSIEISHDADIARLEDRLSTLRYDELQKIYDSGDLHPVLKDSDGGDE